MTRAPSQLDDGPLGLRFKGLPPDAAGLTAAELAAQRRPLFTGGFSWPVMTLSSSAIAHNATLMAEYAHAHGLRLAPHLKTSMSPLLASFPLERGAWGITVATPYQARVFMTSGVERIFLANQLFDTGFITEVCDWLSHADREFVCLVDSVEGVELLDRRAGRPVDVVVEIGHGGGRSGVRDLDTFERVRAAAMAARNVNLRGVTTYEGSLSHSREADELNRVRDFLGVVKDRAERVAGDVDPRRGLLVSAGGSIYFDCVAQVLGPGAFGDVPVMTLIRSGAYLTHDCGLYAEISPLGEHEAHSADQRLRSAIQVWAQVLSRPEPDLLIVGAGRRDLNFDSGLPAPHATRKPDGSQPRDVPGWSTFELNDQHAFCRIPASDPVQLGDLVAFTISHPCTAHDRWTAPVLVDDHDQVVAVARSYF